MLMGAQYFYPSASRQIHVVRTADSFSFVFHEKKKKRNVGGETKLAHNHSFTSGCSSTGTRNLRTCLTEIQQYDYRNLMTKWE